jgi:enoyl-CoA hydratase
MCAALSVWYPGLARDPGIYAVSIQSAVPDVFSVGGDVREVLEAADRDIGCARAGLAAELQLCWLHECFSKPTVSFIDGLVMGTGVGLSLFGTHRVAGEGYRFRMPETAIGYFPDCGVSHAFARMPHGIGYYLGLTGAVAGPADALALGLATHTIGRGEHRAIIAHLADADPVDPVLDSRQRDPGPGPLLTDAPRIARYFDAPAITTIIERLASPASGDETWAGETLAALSRCSPLALCVTYEAIRRAGALDIRGVLLQDYRIAHRLIVHPDFRAGVRAALIDKEHEPRWQHEHVRDVEPDVVERYLSSLGEDELVLPSRDEMQSARV